MKNKILNLLLLALSMSACLESSKKELNHTVLDSLNSEEEILFKKYYMLGKTLYYSRCQNCHGADGKGLGKLIPPLAGADFIAEHRTQLPCVVKFGLNGPLKVNSNSYNQLMPANKDLRPIQVAELLTYIGSSWDNSLGLVSIKEVNESLNECD